jgi:hypothetical protein
MTCELTYELLAKKDKEIAELREALNSANDLCRSAMGIAERNGVLTNWVLFRNRLRQSLELQRKVLWKECR